MRELEMIARSRVSKPYKRRIFGASALTLAAIVTAGIPSGRHVWQIVTIIGLAWLYFMYALWQSMALEAATKSKLEEFKNDISETIG